MVAESRGERQVPSASLDRSIPYCKTSRGLMWGTVVWHTPAHICRSEFGCHTERGACATAGRTDGGKVTQPPWKVLLLWALSLNRHYPWPRALMCSHQRGTGHSARSSQPWWDHTGFLRAWQGAGALYSNLCSIYLTPSLSKELGK